MRVGDEHEVLVEGLTADGQGCARVGGRELRVQGMFPGERARVRVTHVSGGGPGAVASVRVLLTSAAGRRQVPCAQHPARGGACGGCPWMALEPVAQRGQRQALVRAWSSLETAVWGHGPSAELGYRHSSKRVVLPTGDGLALGSYVRGSHQGARMDGCLVDHPRLAALAERIERLCNSLAIEPYRESNGQGDLRYVWLKTDGESELVTLVTAGEVSRAAELLPAQLRDVAGLAWSVQAGAGNALRGRAPRLLSGCAELRPEMAGVVCEVGPLGFLQPNPEVASLAWQRLTGEVPGGALAFDLYAGGGVTTALLRQRFSRVVPCEAYPESAVRLGVAPSTAKDFLSARLEQPERPDLVVTNPPRAGMGEAVSQSLRELGAARLHIMSCSPASLSRDLEVLLARDRPGDGYQIESLELFDTLPQTAHVELVVRLVRVSGMD